MKAKLFCGPCDEMEIPLDRERMIGEKLVVRTIVPPRDISRIMVPPLVTPSLTTDDAVYVAAENE